MTLINAYKQALLQESGNENQVAGQGMPRKGVV